jgi:hypothetical protein
MRTIRFVAACLAGIVASGCLQSSTLITVNADGSGTVEQTTLMSAAALAQLKQFAGSFGGKDTGAVDPFSEQQEREAVAKMGQGVTFVSSTPIKTAEGEGRRTIYRFADINKLSINEQPNAPGGMPMSPGVAAGASQDLSFSLDRTGGDAVLHIRFPEPQLKGDVKDGAPDTIEMPDPGQIAMMKQMLGGLKISVAVKPGGTLVRTNSPYVTGNTVTLFEMDFDQLLANPDALQKLQGLKTIEQAKAAFKNVKGLKVNPDRDVEIVFKPAK